MSSAPDKMRNASEFFHGPSVPAFFLTYHEVSPEDTGYYYHVTSARFAEHLEYIADLQLPKRIHPSVSFDDGHRSCFDHALPLMQHYGIRATFFITAAWTDTRVGYMSGSQLQHLKALGHSIQSHSWSHQMLTTCSDQELKRELVNSKRTLEDMVGWAVDSISIPNGRYDDRVLRAISTAGYRYAFTSDFAPTVRSHAGVEIHGRNMVTRLTSRKQIEKWSNPSRFDIFSADLKQHCKRTIRMVLGEQTYHRLWCKWAHLKEN